MDNTLNQTPGVGAGGVSSGEPPPVAQLHRDAAWTCRPGPQLRTQAAWLFNHLSCVLQNQGVSSHRSQTHPPLWIRRSTGRDVPAALSYTQGTKSSDASTGLAHNTQVQSGRHWVFTNQNTCIAHHTRRQCQAGLRRQCQAGRAVSLPNDASWRLVMISQQQQQLRPPRRHICVVLVLVV